MNDQQHAFWLAYIRKLADLLGLREHKVELSRERPDADDELACCWTSPDVVLAMVRMSERFLLTSTPDEQRAGLAHELLHIHFAAIDAHVRWGVKHLPTDSLVDALPDLIVSDIERATDIVANVVAPFLPLPGNAEKYAETGIVSIATHFANDAELAQALASYQAVYGGIDIADGNGSK